MTKIRNHHGPKARRERGKGALIGGAVTSQAILNARWPVNTAVFFLLILVTVALYAGDLRIGFLILDDPVYVPDNPWIREVSLANLRRIFGAPYFVNYSPVHLLSYMLDYAIAGPSAFAFHLSSNIWAGIVAGFVFLVTLTLTRQYTIAVAAAALFVAHPAHVEAIAWISSRKDLVAAAFALPAFLAYIRYRQSRSGATGWYVASFILFLVATAGKMSVATFPVVLFAYDLFIEKRPVVRSLIDKLPFLLIVVLFALAVASAQPETGRPNAYVIAVAFAQSLWLLSGFGTYVIYHAPPVGDGVLLQIAGVAAILILFAIPLLFRRRWPLGAMLTCWVLFGLVPAQVMSFIHPVADRYLFFPSVGATILIAAGMIELGKRLGRRGLILSSTIIVALTVLWGRTTLAYLSEWKDVRSVWYGATQKTSDPDALYNLGLNYQALAYRLGNAPRRTPLSDEEARRLASAIWPDDPRTPALLKEWSTGTRGGPVEEQFRTHLLSFAWDAYEQRLRAKGIYPLPNLYFHRGVILSDKGEFEGARREFLAAAEEASISGYRDEREMFLVQSHDALGLVALKSGDARDALHWWRIADDEQTRFGGNWVPDLNAKRKKLEAMIGSSPP